MIDENIEDTPEEIKGIHKAYNQWRWIFTFLQEKSNLQEFIKVRQNCADILTQIVVDGEKEIFGVEMPKLIISSFGTAVVIKAFDAGIIAARNNGEVPELENNGSSLIVCQCRYCVKQQRSKRSIN